MIYFVKAQAFNRLTGEATGNSRVEEINPGSNVLFGRCNNIMQVKEAYESFWNEINPSSTDVVFVQAISKTK